MGMGEMLEIIQGEQRYLQRKIARHMQTVVSSQTLATRSLRSASSSACSHVHGMLL
jgi:hypothetical protein